MKREHLIGGDADLRAALAKLNALPGGAMTLFVTDGEGRLCGSLTDGDVRRALIGGATLECRVADAMHTPCRCAGAADVDVAFLRRCRAEGISLVPLTDSEGRPVELADLRHGRSRLPLRALLMAGGRGERLRPATLTTPKPLLRIEGKCIIDYNVEALAGCGITDITVAVRYLAEQLEEHFAAPVAGVQVRCLLEEEPLGTIGAAAALPYDRRATLVMNSDLITTIDFEEMYLRHKEQGNAVTIAAVPYQVSVPYAVLGTDAAEPTRVTAIEEKPSYSYYANAGIYIFEPEALSLLRRGTRTDATDLIATAISTGMRVGYYAVGGTWIDVGSPVDFRQAGELMRHVRSLNK